MREINKNEIELVNGGLPVASLPTVVAKVAVKVATTIAKVSRAVEIQLKLNK